MKKIDQEVLTAFQKIGVNNPEAYIYVVKQLPIWKMILMGGGLFSVFFMKPYMMAYQSGNFYFIRTSMWTTSTLEPDQTMTITKTDITNVKYKKFIAANYFTLTLNNEEKINLVASKWYKKLAKSFSAIF